MVDRKEISRIEVSVEKLTDLMTERSVVTLSHRANQNGHYWAFRLPYMNVVQVPSDLKGYFPLEIKGYEEIELYVSC